MFLLLGLIKQFLRDVDWGELDYLVIDTPPGTSDEHLSVVQYLKSCGLDGAVVVTTPQEVALQDVRKEINFCRKVGVPLLGIVENMAAFVCPHCESSQAIFAPSTGGAAALSIATGVELLGSVPLDPRLARAMDEGVPSVPSPALVALQRIVARLRVIVEQRAAPPTNAQAK